MKPTKNKFMCPDCGKPKMLFQTEKEANSFIKYNGQDITDDVSILRVYYCPSCCGYHISSKPFKKSYNHQTENLINAYKQDTQKNIPDIETLTKTIMDEHIVDVSKYLKLHYPNVEGIIRQELAKEIQLQLKNIPKLEPSDEELSIMAQQLAKELSKSDYGKIAKIIKCRYLYTIKGNIRQKLLLLVHDILYK